MSIAGIVYNEIEFTKEGDIHDIGQLSRVVDSVDQDGTTDLMVISHGWNNNTEEARELYSEFFESFSNVINSPSVAELKTRNLAIVGVLWPSKRFTNLELQPGGGASLEAVGEELLTVEIDALSGGFDGEESDETLDRMRALVPDIADKTTARREFADLARSLMLIDAVLDEELIDEVPDGFIEIDGADLFDLLDASVFDDIETNEGGAAGLVGSAIEGVFGAGSRLLNVLTYWQMKKRAGIVGRNGLNKALVQIADSREALRLHLVGHSFGGRAVSAAVLDGLGSNPPPHSLTLLQAAFSHNGFASQFDNDRDGYYRDIIQKSRVVAPVVITHTRNDRANALAYPLASRISGDNAAGIGDADSLYGAIGSNGAQSTPEAVFLEMQKVGKTYDSGRARVINLKADQFVTSHSDVKGPEAAYAFASAMLMQ